MKRVFFLLVLLMTAGFSFAQVKSVKEAKSLAAGTNSASLTKAEQLITSALTNSESKDLAETWNVAGYVQKRINEEEMKKAYLRQAYDTATVYNSILNMFNYYVKCDELAQIPDEKGKIKNKYRKANAASMINERGNLINGGVYYFNMSQNDKAMNFFGTYVESASYEMLEEYNLQQTDSILAQVAYYAVLAANRANDAEATLKYAKVALDDPENGQYALSLMSDIYKDKGDTVTWIQCLQEGVKKYPDNDYFFANLEDYYNNTNQTEKAMEFVDEMLAGDPNNKLYLYVKGYLYHNMEDYDSALTYYDKTIAADPEYAEAYSNAGLAYLMKAQIYAETAPTEIKDPKYQEAQAQLKSYYEKAKPYYEKARELKPEQQGLWLQGLYRIYYNLNMGEEFEEIDKIVNANY